MEVDALIQAAGDGKRLGLGPKAFVILAGKTLLEHSVDAVLPFADKVIIAVSPLDLERAKKLISNEKILWIEGSETRSSTTRKLINSSTAPWIILHDVVHPLISQEMIKKILDTAFYSQVAAIGIPNTAFLYTPDGKPLHSPGDVIVGQKPLAFSRKLVSEAYVEFDKVSKIEDPSLLEVLEILDVKTNFVIGDSTNIKITTLSDLVIAEKLME
jgi:2-C-methyl-D-erythritol 4-phosphate cytidylyltransferase